MENEICKVTRWQLLKQKLNNLDPEDFRRACQGTPAAQIIDVRTAGEFTLEALPGAVNYDYLAEGFLERLEALNKDKAYFIYCRSGRRSIRTCMLMKNSGFSKVYNLEGGLKAWKECFGEP